jgi:predicted MarR family transcription regulator
MLLEKKDKTRPLQGRMSFDDYKKIRCLLLVNSLDMPKRDQKLQEIVDILEPWFPGIYECIDCFMCF